MDRAMSRARSEIGNLVAPENGESYMALVPRRDCGRKVSTEAATVSTLRRGPSCGTNGYTGPAELCVARSD
jgi:hypothetical protein